MTVPESFQAFRIHNDNDGYRAGLERIGPDDLSGGDVTVRVACSSVNYKDALAGTGQGKILRRFPLNGGIDMAGHVIESRSDRFREGDAVLATGSGLSETRDGGYSRYGRFDSRWLVPLPEHMSLREAMTLGTAGFTAALSLYRLECLGQTPDLGPIVVTGATGGVGSLAIDLLSRAGYEAHAISGKLDRFDWLQELGARQCVDRNSLYLGDRPLESSRWGGAIDNAGGSLLSALTRVIHPWGGIAACGMAGGTRLETTVMPFIIRGVSLLGINSAACPIELREELWRRLAGEWRPRHLDRIRQAEVDMRELPAVFETMLAGDSLGRTLVRIDEQA